MTKPAAPAVLPFTMRPISHTVDARDPRLEQTATVELRLSDLVLLHDGLVVLLTEPWTQPYRDALEALEILQRRLGAVLAMHGIR